MRVRFLRDYRGTLTAERFYRTGEEAELQNGDAAALVADGVCEIIAQEPPAPRRRRK